MSIEFNPFGSGITVQPDTSPEMVGRIAKPDSVRDNDRSCSGTVVSLGPDAPDHLRVGQRVVYSPYSGTMLKVDGVPLYCMTPGEILGMLPEGIQNATP